MYEQSILYHLPFSSGNGFKKINGCTRRNTIWTNCNKVSVTYYPSYLKIYYYTSKSNLFLPSLLLLISTVHDLNATLYLEHCLHLWCFSVNMAHFVSSLFFHLHHSLCYLSLTMFTVFFKSIFLFFYLNNNILSLAPHSQGSNQIPNISTCSLKKYCDNYSYSSPNLQILFLRDLLEIILGQISIHSITIYTTYTKASLFLIGNCKHNEIQTDQTTKNTIH